jgi:hypothetical protein
MHLLQLKAIAAVPTEKKVFKNKSQYKIENLKVLA